MTEPLPARHLYVTFAMLMVLTLTTVGVSYLDLGPWSIAVALAIAFAKAALVSLIFMDVNRSSPLVRLIVLSGLFWLTIMLALTFGDYLTRSWIGSAGTMQSIPGH
jgi:cytochrome c oxidase subunit 4